MPIYQYKCPKHGTIERFFTTFKEAEAHIDRTVCKVENKGKICGKTAERGMEVPLPAHFYGNPEGYYKPSATKRFSTKLVTEKGNDDAAG